MTNKLHQSVFSNNNLFQSHYEIGSMGSDAVSLILPVYNEAKNIETVIRSFFEEINGGGLN